MRDPAAAAAAATGAEQQKYSMFSHAHDSLLIRDWHVPFSLFSLI